MLRIEQIQSDAFAGAPFALVRTLILINFSVVHFHPHTFRGLVQLRSFTFIGMKTYWFPDDFMYDIAHSIMELTVYGSTGTPNNTAHNVAGLTGGGPLFGLARSVQFLLNLRDTISDRTFSGLVYVAYLDLSNCNIEKLDADTFKPVERTLLLLKLDNNRLQRVPPGIFDVLVYRANIAISVDHNPWHCECKLEALRSYMRQYGNKFIEGPLCAWPEHMAGNKVEHADFDCSDNRTDEDVLPVFEVYKMCERSNFAIVGYDSTIQKLMKRKITVVQRRHGDVTVRHTLDEGSIRLAWSDRTISGNSVGVTAQVNHTSNGSIVCLMDRLRDVISPYECVSFRRHKLASATTVWLQLAEKEHVVLGVTFCTVLMMFVGLAGSVLVRWLLPCSRLMEFEKGQPELVLCLDAVSTETSVVSMASR